MRAVARRVPVLIGRQHTSAEVETRIVSAVGRALNRRLIASNDGNPLKTGAGAVSWDEWAPGASWRKPSWL
jgi:hypothetical protein